jgi:threonine/homoserine/homoserine lactone efflux protein
MVDPQVMAFAGIAALLTVTPGADTMMILRSLLARGPKGGFLTMLGICSGLFCHAALSALGVSLILVRSATAFEIVKLLGAGYLVILGALAIWKVRTPTRGTSADLSLDVAAINQHRRWKAFLEGTLTNLLNPKVAVFYLAFLPQFISPHDWVFGKSLLFATIHFAEGVIWYSALIFAFGRMRLLLLRPRVKRSLEALSGMILIGFGLRLALERR